MSTRQRKSPKLEPAPTPEQLVGHVFRDLTLLTRALTHRSLAYETNPETLLDPASDNEQLEFVGDAVLGLIVAESLFHRFPGSREGELTRLRASLVSRKHLAEVAARMDLGSFLLLGRGEETSGGRQKAALLANAIEAVIAALYLDGGLKVAQSFIEQHVIQPTLPELHLALSEGSTFSGAIGDHKSALQEYLQAAGVGQPHYILVDQSGPDHQKSFRIEVRIDDGSGAATALAESAGATKKVAQQEAARLALDRLRSDETLLAAVAKR
jgi:ribonuclease-3